MFHAYASFDYYFATTTTTTISNGFIVRRKKRSFATFRSCPSISGIRTVHIIVRRRELCKLILRFVDSTKHSTLVLRLTKSFKRLTKSFKIVKTLV